MDRPHNGSGPDPPGHLLPKQENPVEVPLLVDDFLRRAASVYADKVAVVDGDLRLSYRELKARVDQLSHALRDMDLEPGDRVCILSPNSHFFLESFYATAQTGIILVPLNYRLVAADHEYILNHAGVRAVLVDWEYTAVIDEIRPNLRDVEHWIVAKDEGPTPDGWTDWNELIADYPATAPPEVPRNENDVVSINYTSGTTARPKGVMLTHRNCYLNALHMTIHLRLGHEDVELWTLPMFHCNGWGGVYALTGVAGTHVILRSIDAERIHELIAAEKVTFACMAPAVLRTILDYPDRAKHDISTTPRFTVAGAPPPAAFIERLEKDLGWSFIEIYGLTETTPILTVSHPDHNTEAGDWTRRASAGVPSIGVRMAVLDEHDRPVPKDGTTHGEICARSNVVFKGYYQQPDQTDAAIRDGWFHTGDLGVWDEHETIFIVDRKKDVIISGGENISSPEIEDALFRNPDVLECAVIGVPHEKWGETPKALVVLRDGAKISEADLIAFCREHLAHFKCPTSVDFVDELPRTATGKLQKFKLRERFWAGAAKRVN
jgi:fatty-acyl-CoA synthase